MSTDGTTLGGGGGLHSVVSNDGITLGGNIV